MLADWSQKTASKVVRTGNQFVRTKKIVTPIGSTTIKLQGDKIELEGGKLVACDVFGSKKVDITPAKAAKIFFDNFERLFDPKYDAWPDIKKALS